VTENNGETKDTEPARAALDLNSRAAEKDKKKARAGMRAAAEGRKGWNPEIKYLQIATTGIEPGASNA